MMLELAVEKQADMATGADSLCLQSWIKTPTVATTAPKTTKPTTFEKELSEFCILFRKI
jgi:hypothetical protein